MENCRFIIQIFQLMFRQLTVARERKSVRVYEQIHKETPPTRLTSHPNWQQLPTSHWQLKTFLKLANFYISKFSISVVWWHLIKLLHHLTRVPKFTVFISPIKHMTRHESILFTFGLPVLVAGALAWTFQSDLHFRLKILANLTADWKTRGPTKPDKIINTINHHGN